MHSVLKQLIEDGKIIDLKNGSLEVFSKEAVKSESGHGQVADTGDWVRFDGDGYPYLCKNEWIQENMKHVDDNGTIIDAEYNFVERKEFD